ncbi:MAG: type IV pilus biogenesis/stability protein PilW [Candidatus Methylumidiphilus sp.]
MRVGLGLLSLACLGVGACTSDSPKDQDPRTATELYVMKGVQYMEKGRLDIAQQDLERAVELDDGNAEAHNALGVLYERLNRTEDSEAQYKLALALDDQHYAAETNYGRLLCAQGKYDLAMKHFQKVIDAKSYQTPWLVLTNAGICAKSKGSAAEAEGYLRKALSLLPDFPPALLEMAKLSFEQGSYLSARAFLQRYESTVPPTPESLFVGVQNEQALGNSKNADAYRKKLQKLFPDSKEAMRSRKSHASQ